MRFAVWGRQLPRCDNRLQQETIDRFVGIIQRSQVDFAVPAIEEFVIGRELRRQDRLGEKRRLSELAWSVECENHAAPRHEISRECRLRITRYF
jgi:hypothetical protein